MAPVAKAWQGENYAEVRIPCRKFIVVSKRMSKFDSYEEMLAERPCMNTSTMNDWARCHYAISIDFFWKDPLIAE